MSLSRILRNSARVGVVAAAAGAAIPAAYAQQLEEVVVTAQVRAQSLQDVPVSVNAVAGDKMMEAGIGKIEDLQAYVPNLTMSETGIGTNIYVRGIGSGINQGFEQSVGMYFDGISYGRAQLARAPFLDLERVEVLRGPQNILYGKSSIAGALSLISAKPGQEFETYAQYSYEPSHGEQIVDFMISGPITDTFGARLALRKKDVDGYIENLTLGGDEPSRDEQTIRLVFDWIATDSISAKLKLEQSTFDVSGRQIEIDGERPGVESFEGKDFNSGFHGLTYAEILDDSSAMVGPVPLVTIDQDSSVLNNTIDYKRSANGDFSNNEINGVTLNVDYEWGDHTFTFITGYMEYEYSETCDCDFTGAELFLLDSAEEYSQFSQEFRWVSPVGETWEFIGGGFYQTTELTFFDQLYIDSEWTTIPDLLDAVDLQESATPGNGRGEGLPGDAGSFTSNLSTPRDFTSDTELFSVFLQGTAQIAETLRLTVGGRYSYETKDGSRRLEFADFDTGNIRPVGEVDTVVITSFKAERHNLSGERTESNFAPSINLQWDATDEMMVYATLSRGYKSGGFDARSNASPSTDPVRPLQNALRTDGRNVVVGSFEFEEEVADSFELGFKSSLFDGRMELNTAFFFTKYSDLQVSVFDGTLGFNVGNAGAAETMGIELDGRFAISDYLILTYAMAWLDFEFTDFENGQCAQGQLRDSTGPGNAPFCDFTGDTNQYAADLSGNLSLAYNRPFAGDRYELRANLDTVFTTDFHPTQNLDENYEQEGYAKFNGRLAVAALEQGWEVALVGKNLTDETTVSYANATPLAFSNFGAASYYAFVAPERTIGVQLGFRFE